MKVAVDGYSSTGKSTVAKMVAAELGLIYIDTGAMYRAVTLYAMNNGMLLDGVLDEPALISSLSGIYIDFIRNEGSGNVETVLNGTVVEKEIRRMDVSDHVSTIAAVSAVRHFLVGNQRRMAEGKDVIMDGRDIGSVVFPDADVKFFLTASVEVRAKRRYDELLAKGEKLSMEEVRANIEKRDYIDSHRKESPLIKVDDAIVIDNGNMTIKEVVAAMVAAIHNMRVVK